MKRLILVPLLIFITSVASADTSDPSSLLYRGGAKKTQIDYTLTATSFRGFDEFARLGLSYTGTATLRLKSAQALSVSLSYSHPDDFEASNPDFWGLEDLAISYTKSGLFKTKNRRSTFRVSLGLPTSQTSQNAGQFFRSAASLATSWNWGRNSLILVPGVVLAQHEFETSNASGFVNNSPFGVSTSLILRRRVLKRLTLSASGRLFNFYDYDFKGRLVQSLSVSAFMPVSKKASLSVGFLWRDRFVSNNSLLDDDTSQAFLSLIYQL